MATMKVEYTTQSRDMPDMWCACTRAKRPPQCFPRVLHPCKTRVKRRNIRFNLPHRLIFDEIWLCPYVDWCSPLSAFRSVSAWVIAACKDLSVDW
jgi:hypothetical protein